MPTSDLKLTMRYQSVLASLQQATVAAGRPVSTVSCLAVSKGHTAEAIGAVAALGQTDFAESRVQEAVPKIAALDLPTLRWHFIGPIQSNKTAQIAQHFAWVHSISREKIAQRLNEARSEQQPPLQVCVQLALTQDAHREGVAAADLPALCAAISDMPRLHLRGLMCIPPPLASQTEQRAAFKQCYACFTQLQKQGYALDTLSMGMSADYEAAIMEGATVVRIGTAIFGSKDVG